MTVTLLKFLQLLALKVGSLRFIAQPRVTHVLQTKRSEYPKHRNTRPWHICFLQFLLRKPKILTFLEAECAVCTTQRTVIASSMWREFMSGTSGDLLECPSDPWVGRKGRWMRGCSPLQSESDLPGYLSTPRGVLQSAASSTAIFVQTCSCDVNKTTICRLIPFNYLHPLRLNV